jgi:hypothetical protein
MAEIGLYGSLKDYVKQQLKVRRSILSNPRSTTIGINQYERDGQTSKSYVFDSSNDFQTNSRLGPEQFYAYTTQKVCTIRMVSGVDIEESAKNKLLKPNKFIDENKLIGQNLAALYMLEGGTINANPVSITNENDKTYYGIQRNTTRPRGGFDRGRGAAYGDPNIRAHPTDGFGIVPMPGITDAKINTVSAEGALREAIVNFSCYNRAQLEILETLYMRPGYNVLLEWGWNPYIGNLGDVEDGNYSAIDKFFDPNSDFDIINEQIRKNKENSSGNYDGFIGYVKNFSYQAREDGGYDCTTELISSNSLLESLQAGRKVDFLQKDGEVVVEDEFLYYLRAIQKNIYKDGARYYQKLVNTTEEFEQQKTEQRDDRIEGYVSQSQENPIAAIGLREQIQNDYLLTAIMPEKTTDRSQRAKQTTEKIRELNNREARYLLGFNEIEKLILKINKGNITDEPDVLKEDLTGRGFQSFLNGTMLKQVVQYDPKEEQKQDGEPGDTFTTSGFESHVYVRWDLVVQIINHLITDQYKEGKPIVELTYCNENTPTVFDIENLDSTGSLGPELGYYLPYSAPKDIESADPAFFQNKSKEVQIPIKTIDKYSPLLGQSYDYNICLLPHMRVFDKLYSEKEEERGFDRDPNIRDKDNTQSFKLQKPTLLTSFLGEMGAKRESIGLIYLNLEYLIKEYEGMRLQTVKAESDESTVYTRFRDDFSMLKYLQTVWGSVNNACANYYDFDIHTELERPHIARVVEKNFRQRFNEEDLFEFRPQGLESITRNFMFSSKISKDIASVISIAAQVPNEEQSLSALSFKAFHKNIKSRFTSLQFTEKERHARQEDAKKDLKADIESYKKMTIALKLFMERLYKSDFTSEYDEDSTSKRKSIISPKTAIQYAQEIEELRVKILNRYPLSHPEAGFWRPGTTHLRSAIIPLEFSLQLDGIAGLIPYQVFKISPDKLPYDYQGKEVAFIIKNEAQSIGADGDWVTDITGQLVLLNFNSNNDGIQDETENENESENESQLDTIDASETQCTTAYSFGFTPAPNGDPEWDGSNITADKISLKDTIEALEDLGYNKNAVIGTFAVFWSEASKYKTNGKNAGFNSSGAHNYAGIQTDNRVWTGTSSDGSTGPIQAQYCRKDAKGYRAFAAFENADQFLKFVAFQHKRKGLHASSADVWTEKYINSWWSPAEKNEASHKKGGTVFNGKKAIYNTAVRAYNAIKDGFETYPI